MRRWRFTEGSQRTWAWGVQGGVLHRDPVFLVPERIDLFSRLVQVAVLAHDDGHVVENPSCQAG